VSGVGVGVGATRRGRDDWACEDIVANNASTTPSETRAIFGSLGIRFFIVRILSDFQQNLQIN
jgi:hypothetical protein